MDYPRGIRTKAKGFLQDSWFFHSIRYQFWRQHKVGTVARALAQIWDGIQVLPPTSSDLGLTWISLARLIPTGKVGMLILTTQDCCEASMNTGKPEASIALACGKCEVASHSCSAALSWWDPAEKERFSFLVQPPECLLIPDLFYKNAKMREKKKPSEIIIPTLPSLVFSWKSTNEWAWGWRWNSASHVTWESSQYTCL